MNTDLSVYGRNNRGIDSIAERRPQPPQSTTGVRGRAADSCRDGHLSKSKLLSRLPSLLLPLLRRSAGCSWVTLFKGGSETLRPSILVYALAPLLAVAADSENEPERSLLFDGSFSLAAVLRP